MSYFLVAPALDLAIELFLPEELERAVALQWERLHDRASRDAFTRRLSRQLEGLLPEAIDWDIKEPTPAQLSFALILSKELGIAIPADAQRYRGLMHEFIERHAPEAKERWAQKGNK